MASESPGRGIAFTGALSSTAQVTQAIAVDQYQQASFQIRGDASAVISYSLQASNIPSAAADQGPPYRDDSATSKDWATIQTGSVPATAPQTAIVSLASVPFRAMRLSLTSTGTPTVSVAAFGTGAAS